MSEAIKIKQIEKLEEEIKTYNLVKAVYVVPNVYLNFNVVEGEEITDEVEFIRLATSVGQVFTGVGEFQNCFNNGHFDDSYILIK